MVSSFIQLRGTLSILPGLAQCLEAGQEDTGQGQGQWQGPARQASTSGGAGGGDSVPRVRSTLLEAVWRNLKQPPLEALLGAINLVGGWGG